MRGPLGLRGGHGSDAGTDSHPDHPPCRGGTRLKEAWPTKSMASPCGGALHEGGQLIVVTGQHKHSGVPQRSQTGRQRDLRGLVHDAVVKGTPSKQTVVSPQACRRDNQLGRMIIHTVTYMYLPCLLTVQHPHTQI